MQASFLPELKEHSPAGRIRIGWIADFEETKECVAFILAQAVAAQAIPLFIAYRNNPYLTVPSKEEAFTDYYEISINKVYQALQDAKIPVPKQYPYKEWAEAIAERDYVEHSFFSKLLLQLTREVDKEIPKEFAAALELKHISGVRLETELYKLDKSFRIKTTLWTANVKQARLARAQQRLDWNSQFKSNLEITADRICRAFIMRIKEDLNGRIDDPYQRPTTSPMDVNYFFDFSQTLKLIKRLLSRGKRPAPFNEWIGDLKTTKLEDNIDSPYFIKKFIKLFKNVGHEFTKRAAHLEQRGIVVTTKLDKNSVYPYFQIRFHMLQK